MGKYSSPPSAGTQATAQTASNVQTAAAQQMLNSTDQYSPWGSITYEPDWESGTTQGYPNRWIQETTLSPEQQQIQDYGELADIWLGQLGTQQIGQIGRAISPDLSGQIAGLDSGMYNAQGYGDLQQNVGDMWSNYQGQMGGYDRAEGALSGLADYSGTSDIVSGTPELNAESRKRYEDALFGRMASQIETDRSTMETSLANQGIGLGSTAYRTANQGLEDDIGRRRMEAVLAGGEEQRAEMQAELGRRQAIYDAIMGEKTAGDTQKFELSNALASLTGQRAGENQRLLDFGANQIGQIAGLRGQQFSQDQATRSQQLYELITGRQQPINEISALLQGVQVQQPEQQQTPQAGVGQTDVIGAYGNQQAGQQAKSQQAGQTAAAVGTAIAAIAAAY